MEQMSRINWNQIATKDDMTRLFKKLTELHLLLNEHRKDFARELRFWRRVYGGKKLWRLINRKTGQPPEMI